MATGAPYARLRGTLKVYIAPTGESEPAVNATPAGNWVLLGPTDEAQTIPEYSGALEYFRDNDHQGPVAAVRPEEDVTFTFNLVGLTLENYARILSDVANVTSASGPPATKKMPLKRGATPTEYALLFRGPADSPYGNYPGQYYCPRAVSDSEPSLERSRGGSPMVECTFNALEDDNQTTGNEMGWLTVQTS